MLNCKLEGVFNRVVYRVGFFLMKKKIKFQINNYSIKRVRKHICTVREFLNLKLKKIN
jgi:hypothetical protein